MQKTDTVVVLRRVNYGEKDRIVTYLGTEHGKFAVLAKSVRGPKSRLAGGCEPLSLVEVTFVQGKSNLYALSGVRLIAHYQHIVGDLDRMHRTFANLKIIDKLAHDGEGHELHNLLRTYLETMNDLESDPILNDIWLWLHLLSQAGSMSKVNPVVSGGTDTYRFDHDHQMFVATSTGSFTMDDVKVFLLSEKARRPIRLTNQLDLSRIEALARLLLKTNLLEV